MQNQITHDNLNPTVFPEQSFKQFAPPRSSSEAFKSKLTSSRTCHSTPHSHWYCVESLRDLVPKKMCRFRDGLGAETMEQGKKWCWSGLLLAPGSLAGDRWNLGLWNLSWKTR